MLLTWTSWILTDLILGSPSPWGEAFDPARFEKRPKPKGEIRERFRTAGGVIEMPGEVLDAALSRLGNGFGMVLTHNDRSVAIYRDMEGRVHSLDPTCMRMACQVSWNDAGRSWGCHCHGSLYDALGRVIESSTVTDLKRKEIRRILPRLILRMGYSRSVLEPKPSLRPHGEGVEATERR